MDVLGWLYDLSKAFFEAFATAITQYPLSTILVFLAVFFLFHQKRLLILYNFNERTIKKKYSVKEGMIALAGFVVAVILSHVVGYVFWIVAKIVEWIFKGLGFAFGTGQTLTSPFSSDPLAYLIVLCAAALIGFIYILWKSQWTVRRANPVRILATGFVVLLCAYIGTSIYVAVSPVKPGTHEDATTPGKEADRHRQDGGHTSLTDRRFGRPGAGKSSSGGRVASVGEAAIKRALGATGVVMALREGLDIDCPCMGSVPSVLLSTVTLTEDFGVAAMAAILLATAV